MSMSNADISKRLKAAHPNLAPIYEAALELLMPCTGAIIFPEQFLNYDRIWLVSFKVTRRVVMTVDERLTHVKQNGIITETPRTNPTSKNQYVNLYTDDEVIKAEQNDQTLALGNNEGEVTYNSINWWEGGTYGRPVQTPWLPRLDYEPDKWTVKGDCYNAAFGHKDGAAAFAMEVMRRVMD